MLKNFFSLFLLWPWLLPAAVLLACAVAYFDFRQRRAFYLSALGGTCI